MESIIDQSCPICNSLDGLKLFVHISEIPYFGEHTQMTMMCDSCGSVSYTHLTLPTKA